MDRILQHLRHVLRDERGTISVLSIYFLMAAAIMSGLAIDFTNRTAKETKLQTAADAVAHAALLTRKTKDASTAMQAALDIAATNLPAGIHGNAIQSSDIEFGTWDLEAKTFTPDVDGDTAVRVRAFRNAERDNVVPNLLLRIIGFPGFEAEAESIFSRWEPPCFKSGFVAMNAVDIQGNNSFGADFCMHANGYIKMSNDNTFADGAVVSLENVSDIVLPSSGMESNDGLEEALTNGTYNMSLLKELETVVDELENGGTTYTPDYITGMGTIFLNNKDIKPTEIVEGRVHKKTCSDGKNVNVKPGKYENFVLVTNCKLKFQKGVVLENATIASTSTNTRAFNAPSGLVLGRDDDCAPGGGVSLITYGGFDAAASLEIYGSQIIARKNIEFAAQADGVQGVSMISGINVDTTSNVAMNGCPEEGMDLILVEKVMRMVQ